MGGMDDLPANVLEDLLDVGIALSGTRDLHALLDRILREARRFTAADAGTLYLLENDKLRAEIGQNRTFETRWGEEEARRIFQRFEVPVGMNSIAGAAAATRSVVNIPDVQTLDAASPFQYDPRYDRERDYSTHSNLAVPMINREGAVIGVLQLINACSDGAIRPFDPARQKVVEALASQAAVAIENARLTTRLREAHLDTLTRLGIAAEWRDKETANHILRVSQYCRLLAETLGWPASDVELITRAAPMHDVGKLGIPDAILHKPGKLDEDERRIMMAHPTIGANIMARADNPEMRWSRVVALGHHERWDGRGYPRGLAGTAIPMSCRLVGLADVYDALSSRRCYKPAFPDEKVMDILAAETGRHFDPAVMEAFQASLDSIHAVRDRYADRDEDFAKFRDYEHLELVAD